MKKILPSLVAAFLFSAIIPVHATLMVYGIVTGVVTDAGGGLKTTVGMPVSGYFSYDYDLLSAPDSLGHRTVSTYDPGARFSIFSSVGEGDGYGNSSLGNGNLQLTVDANGLPYFGIGIGEPDMSLTSASVGLLYGYINNQPIGWGADVTYTVTGVPDISATWFLLGLGLASVTVARHFFRQIRV